MDLGGRIGKWHVVEPGIEIDAAPAPPRPAAWGGTSRRSPMPTVRWRRSGPEMRTARRPPADTVGWGSEEDVGGLRRDRWKGGE